MSPHTYDRYGERLDQDELELEIETVAPTHVCDHGWLEVCHDPLVVAPCPIHRPTQQPKETL